MGPPGAGLTPSARATVITLTGGWFGNDPPAHRFPADLANTDALLRHAASLQGIDSDLALLFGRWRHLPYWLDSIWVPGDMLIRPFLFDRMEHGPFFIGSAMTLAAELDEIANASPLGLREAAVAGNPAGGGAAEGGPIRDAWQSYRDAARLALTCKVPMWTEM